jgi:hypothetical protein
LRREGDGHPYMVTPPVVTQITSELCPTTPGSANQGDMVGVRRLYLITSVMRQISLVEVSKRGTMSRVNAAGPRARGQHDASGRDPSPRGPGKRFEPTLDIAAQPTGWAACSVT